MKQKTRRHWSMGLRYRTACCGKFASVCRSNRAQLDFSGMGPAATRGTARNVNAPVEIAGFDFLTMPIVLNVWPIKQFDFLSKFLQVFFDITIPKNNNMQGQ
jgi:hypothetical protein